jgi:hypothetical protein
MIFLGPWNRVSEFERRDHGGCFEELGCRDGIFFTFPFFPFFRPELFSIGKLIHLMKPHKKAPSGATYSAGNCLAELFSKKKARGHLPSSSPTLCFTSAPVSSGPPGKTSRQTMAEITGAM